MKNGIIFCQSSTWASKLDIEYLDETSDIKRNQQQDLKQGIGQKLRQFVEYASKEEIGQVYGGGFFHFQICANPDGSMCGQKSLGNRERKKRIVKVWSDHLEQYPTAKVIQKRLVFSMSREFHDQLVAAGINPDFVLVRTTQDVLRRFQERFHKGDSIGYAYGLHHDTENLHIHVALCPRTKNGRYVGLSKPKFSAKLSGNLDQHTFLIQQFQRLNRKWDEALADPRKLWDKLQRTPANERLVFAPHLTQAKFHAFLNSRNSVATELAFQYHRIVALQSQVNEKRAAIAARRNVGAAFRFAGIRMPFRSANRRKQEQDIAELRLLCAELRRKKQDYFFRYQQFQKHYSHAHARSQSIRIASSGSTIHRSV